MTLSPFFHRFTCMSRTRGEGICHAWASGQQCPSMVDLVPSTSLPQCSLLAGSTSAASLTTSGAAIPSDRFDARMRDGYKQRARPRAKTMKRDFMCRWPGAICHRYVKPPMYR